jgi:signal transduction protein with GAF and PtsI domain
MPSITDALEAVLTEREAPDWDRVLAEILQAFDCTTGTLHAWNAELQRLVLLARQGIPDFLLPKMSEIPIGKGMAGIAAERRAPVQICNLQTDESGVARPSAKETKVEGALTIPLLSSGLLCGTLGIAKSVPYEFSDEEIDALVAYGNRIVPILPNAPSAN